MLHPMNSIHGLRPLDLPLAGQAAAWPGAPANTASHGSNASRWLDGLTGSTQPTLTADVPPSATGLGAAAHAERVLGALLAQ
jgi:hypothetical protein